ncbi:MULTISPECIES: hypothetical protein [Myxococcus]|uniref:hypothetical protein n=1 Tax=Myxococcus TaxID=32 RepID=UPI0013CFF3E5|nr:MULTISPECIES: hypothetical protein [Myxococcus]NVJ24065.1 hypothetical protein [Myxococcus sp. AM011]
MHPSRVLRAATLLLATLTLTPSALAAAEEPQFDLPYVFETVDSYEVVHADTIQVTGVLQGESAPRTLEFSFPYSPSNYDNSQHISRCDRMALLVMNKPGAYLLEMTLKLRGQMVTCKLTRRAATPAP